MVDVEAVRRLLGVADVGKDPYAVAAVAGQLLAINEADGVAAGRIMRGRWGR